MRASPFLLSSRGHRSDDSTGYEVETEDESYVGYQRAVRGKNVRDVKSLLDPPGIRNGFRHAGKKGAVFETDCQWLSKLR